MDANIISLLRDTITATSAIVLAWIGYLSVSAKFQITALKNRVSHLEIEQARCHEEREDLREKCKDMNEILADKFPSNGILLDRAKAKVKESGLPNTNSNVLAMFRKMVAEQGGAVP